MPDVDLLEFSELLLIRANQSRSTAAENQGLNSTLFVVWRSSVLSSDFGLATD